MNQEKFICPRCKAYFPRGAADGLCPVCLLTTAATDPGEDLLSLNSDAAEDADDVRSRRTIGAYELLAEIGHGGMGIVYRARQRGLNRIVALKMVLARQLAGPEAVARFRAEAELASQLQHPGIVAIHEIGEHEGEPFFSMDYVEGRSLAELVREHPLPSRAAATYVKAVAEAIHYAHRHGILHRDLKPSNILIDASDLPRVTDFGLAKRLEEDSDLTLTGQMVGSPSFAAPEQVIGQRHHIGPATDVYSLGAVLYHLLVRRPPFVSETMGATIRLVQEADPLPVRRLNPAVPEDLETICLKCLEKDPDRRYPTAAELAEELGRFLRSEPIRAKPPGAVGRVLRWYRRKPVVAGLVAALGLSLLAILLGLPIALVRIERARGALEHEAYNSNVRLAKNYIDEGSIDQAMSILTNCPPTYRHWEWGHLVWLCHQEICTLQAQPVPRYITSGRYQLAFDPSGEVLFSRLETGLLQLWDLPSRKEVRHWGGGDNQVLHAAFAPDGKRLAIGFANGTIELWQLPTRPSPQPPFDQGQLLRQLRAGSTAVKRLCWNREGNRLLSGRAGMIQLWNTESGEVELQVLQPPGDLQNLCFDAEEKRIVAGSDGAFGVWDRQTGVVLWRGSVDQGAGQRSLVPSPDGTRWILEMTDRQLLLAGTNGTRPLIVAPDLDEGAGAFQRGSFSPDGRLVCNTGEPGTARVWSADDARERFAIPLRVRRARFSPDGRLLATCGGYNFASVWDVATGREVRRLCGHQGTLEEIQFSPDSRLVATMDMRNTLKVWIAEPGRNHLRHSNAVTAVAFSPDGQRLATAEECGGLRVWAADSGRLLTWINGPPERTHGLAFNPEGTKLAAAGTHRLVRLYEAESGRHLSSWEAHERTVLGLAFNHDGQRLFTYSFDGVLKLWNPANGQLRRAIDTGIEPRMPGSAMSHDGQWLAAGDGKGRVALWEAATGREISGVQGHSNAVYSLAFTPDSRRLVSCGYDGVSTLWKREALRPIAMWTARGCDWPVMFSRDGQRLFAGTTRYDAPAYDRPRVVVRDATDGHEVLGLDDAGLCLSLDYHDTTRQLAIGAGEGSAVILEAFPWREDEYPGDGSMSLTARLRLYADRYWEERLAGEGMAGLERRVSRARDEQPAAEGPAVRPYQVVSHSWEPWLFPARDPRATARQIDLGRFYTSPLTRKHYPLSLVVDYADWDLRQLPRGLATFQGIAFDVRGVIQLRPDDSRQSGRQSWSQVPDRVRDIPVGQKCRSIHVLHGCVGEPDGMVIGRYLCRYADGTSEACDIVSGTDVCGYECSTPDHPDAGGPVQGKLAWAGSNPSAQFLGRVARVYLSTYLNPRPEVEIVSLDFVSELTAGAPFLVAITLE